jgi:hypothetical protein
VHCTLLFHISIKIILTVLLPLLTHLHFFRIHFIVCLYRPVTGDISLDESWPTGRPRGTAPPRRAGGWADENSRYGEITEKMKLQSFFFNISTYYKLLLYFRITIYLFNLCFRFLFFLVLVLPKFPLISSIPPPDTFLHAETLTDI